MQCFNVNLVFGFWDVLTDPRNEHNLVSKLLYYQNLSDNFKEHSISNQVIK